MDVSRRGFLRLALATAAVAAVAPSSLIGTSEYVSERDKVQISGIPYGWAVCDGSRFDTMANPKLASILGGNTLPDLTGQFIRTDDRKGGEARPVNRVTVHLIKITDGEIPMGSVMAYFANPVT